MKIVNESKSFSNRKILDHISFDFSKGLYKVEGNNGSGKTTFLRLLAGLERFDSGHRLQHKGDILYLDTNAIGVVPLTIEDNLTLLWKTFNASPDEETLSVIDQFFGERLLDHYLTASVGTKAKVGLSLLFVKDWDYIFIDEALLTLDGFSLDMVAGRLLALKEKATVFYVSHNLSHKQLLSESRVIYLNGKGEIY
ncbi:ABC transporter ATP-binding protein [Streptococcus equi]|uniref:ABC transporter ATP-binding protein n=1 Tax=Streptococcus equi TaxID=1336 RepID=UPI0024A9EBE2|nr:ATP-binding cassette domain-containing protein [Streptococcus equi]MDI5954610.1 ATP-binding cassette domain-containing protein [Streptococcus equi subsp. zooepidemicus]HEL1111937.1 ATP-binding cassette domain-containing protein [Streptococcus equi subsp. zooepidemicus]HEL1144368.1 ATP-binding cassette domain-containing protein [Streptococcus equi subsp. zooepidemicus]